MFKNFIVDTIKEALDEMEDEKKRIKNNMENVEKQRTCSHRWRIYGYLEYGECVCQFCGKKAKLSVVLDDLLKSIQDEISKGGKDGK